MENKGWIKLHRKLLDCWIWDVKPYDKARAWVDLLLLAMHHDKRISLEDKPMTIRRGSYFTSRKQLADRWGWSVKKVDTYLKTLEEEKMITTLGSTKGTEITIVNYEEYQLDEISSGTSADVSHGSLVNSQNNNRKNNISVATQNMKKALEEWNSLSTYGIKPVGKLNSGTQRQQMLQARIAEYGIDDVLKAMGKIKESSFLQGKHGGKPWQITFDWFVRPNNFPKVLDGNYDNGGVRNNGCVGTNAEQVKGDAYTNEFDRMFE